MANEMFKLDYNLTWRILPKIFSNNLNIFTKRNEKGKKNSNHLKLPANLCLNGSVWVFVLLSLDGPGLETDALLTCPLVVVVDPRLNSVRDLKILWICGEEYEKRDTEWGKVNVQLIMWLFVLKLLLRVKPSLSPGSGTWSAWPTRYSDYATYMYGPFPR